MTAQNWNAIAVFINNNWGTIVTMIGVAWAYLVHVAPNLKNLQIATFITNAVNALQQTVAAPTQRFADADAALAKQFPHLTADERKLWIEARVALSKVASGTSFEQLPPAAPSTPPIDMQALFTKAFSDAAPAIEQMLEQKVATLRTAAQARPAPARTPAGTFAPATPTPDAAPADPSTASATGA